MKQIFAFLLLCAFALPVYAQHDLQIDDGSGAYVRFRATGLPVGVTIFTLPSTGGTLVTTSTLNAWLLTGNSGTTPGTNYLGTNDDQPFEIHIGNSFSSGTDGRGRVMRYETNATSANIIGGYHTNSITAGIIGGTISGGGSTGSSQSIASNYGTIGGGNRNTIGASSINATIAGGVSNSVTSSAGNGTIGGGLGNVITSGDHTTIAGGFNNQIQTGSFGCTISGGTNNVLASHTSVISGGNANALGTSAQFSTISGGDLNYIGNSSFGSSIGGGVSDTIFASSPYSRISGGTTNTIGTGAGRSAIAGGQGLTLNGGGSFGFLGANTGSNNMTISATNTAVFGNTDLWLANNRNQASELRFFEAYNTAGAFPNTAKYVGFKAPASVTTSTTYTLPAADGTNGQTLKTDGAGTLSWGPASISYLGGNTNGNSVNGTFIQIGGSGSTAVENNAKIVVTRTVTLQNLFVNLSAAPGAGTSKTVTIRKNGVNTVLAVTVANAATTANSGATTVTFNAGDLISVEVDHTGAPANSVVMIGFEMAM